MDISDDYDSSRIPNASDEEADRLLDANGRTVLDEESARAGWAVNGMRKLQLCDVGVDDFALEDSDLASEGYHDIINTYMHNAEGSMGANRSTSASFDNNNKMANFNHLPLLSEVLRISKILRRLMIESNRKSAVDLCKKLDAAVRNQSNAPYICRSFDILFDNMITVLRQCPPECLEHASEILGIMGYINRYDFVVYKNHLTKSYANIKTLRKYLMIALRTTLRCDAVNLDLKAYSERLLSLLKEYLENAEVAENFMAISETICELSKHYKQSFQRHFTDIVDIIIGWHLETEQPVTLKRHCAKVLQQFADYFLSELDFTLGLLGQFNEDIEACGEEMVAEDVSIKSKQQTEARVGAFIGAFTSIIKAMVSKGIGPNQFATSENIISNAKRIVNNVAKRCFHATTLISEETVINLNEFYCVIAMYDKSVENLCDLEGIMELQLKHLAAFNENQVSSFLYMILNIVRQYRTQLPLSFVSLIMAKDNLVLQELRIRCGSKSYNLLLKTYHEILVIKNVPLLQEAYRHILKDVCDCITTLRSVQVSVHTAMRCEMTLSFYLAALLVLACQTSSIIGMYALNPSILELLVANCQAANEALWSRYPTLHQALLAVIIEHSSKNYNFRQSSRLLSLHQDSPSSENFGIILHFLSSLVKWYVSAELLDWLQNLVEECQEYFDVLIKNDDFLEICKNVTNLSLENPMICLKFMATILRQPKMPDHIWSNINDVAICVLQRSDGHHLNAYCKLFALLPVQICLSPQQDVKQFHRMKEKLRQMFHWHKTTAYYNTLRPKYFKAFVEALEPSPHDNDCLFDTFIEKSFVHLHKEGVSEYLQLAQQNKQLLRYHLQYEASRYCVQQKLRTTLGKPQETFLAIEAIVMKYARFLAEKECVPTILKDPNNVMGLQQNCHMLLGFLDNLEKHIYNAAEGTAFAMLPAEKPAKTFFRVNVTTCREWFKRIHTAVNLIALHCMSPEIVIRNCEEMLQNESTLTNLGFLGRTVTSMVWALFTCSESDTLHGLLCWLKSKNCKGYDWIQYVAEHASGHFEKAAAGYFLTLNAENFKNTDTFTKDFVQRQLIDCLHHTSIWSETTGEKQERSSHKLCLDRLEAVVNHGLKSDGDEQFASALLNMTTWNDFTNDKTVDQLDTFSSYEILGAIQKSCLRRAVSIGENGMLLDPVKIFIRQGLRAGLICSHEPGCRNNQFNDLVLLNHVVHKLDQHDNISICSSFNEISFTQLNNSLSWSLVMGQKSVEQNIPLLLSVAAKARMDNNLNYCQSLLERFFICKSVDKPLSQIALQLQTRELNLNYDDPDMIQGVEVLVKYMEARNTSPFNALEVASTCCFQLIQSCSEKLSYQNELPSSALSLLLSISDWLALHRLHNPNLASGNQFQNLQGILPDISFCTHELRSSCFLPPLEYAIGKLLNAGILCKDNSGEAWLAFGNWCYRWGKKLMESSGSELQLLGGKEMRLTNPNITSIREILGENLNDESMNRIVELLHSHMIRAISDDNLEGIYTHSVNTKDMLEHEFKKFCHISTEQLNSIICIWRKAHKNVYGFYEEATKAYFMYLAIESDATLPNKTKTTSCTQIEDCAFVNTTLRLLRLIVKHAIGLQDVLEDGMRNTPLRPWKVIVPQLFSRLNHHEPYVRHSVSDLLCRLAVNQPQLIIFPAVVGAQQELKNSNNADNQIQLTNCFVTLLTTLAHQSPDVVLQVQLLVRELRRITLLWEEHWLQGLAQVYADYYHLYNALEAESKKAHNTEMMSAKYEIFRLHLLADFRQIAVATEKEPETNYERSFQERFKPQIEVVLNELQNSANFAKPVECWQKIKQLYNIFQQRPLRGNSSTIRIADISPVLANMHNTSIAMPGVDIYEKSAVHIKSVDSNVFILPTKTKPKKVSLKGSNGQSYTYLFKGQEDLHLDERIMQFLSISNSMMSRSYGSKSKTDCFKAHHYSVIPLGSQSGLISWVENCTPLFAVYKKWQQREAALKQQQKERHLSKSHDQAANSPATANTLRPSELFYNKLTPLLVERNLKVSDPRRQWPLPLLKQVLSELCSETPKDLLSKEIWCYSTNAVDWRKSVRRYTMSIAVMSVIGYVIGLGDRHLDNILIKLGTGEIVHIDYNVCFEKGKSLRVPEKVPFRMTQNLKDALGLVGTEGPFRMTCSHVLKILRKERETLLTLLEAFVYDPLVDWTVSDDGGTAMSRGTSAHNAVVLIAAIDSSKDLQLSPKDTYKTRKHNVDLSRQTLALKISDIKTAWLKYRNDFDHQLSSVRQHVQNLLDMRQKMVHLEQERDNFTKQQAMIRELDALGSARGSHALNTVTQRYNVYKRDLESFMKTKHLVEQTIEDLDLVLMTYFDTILRAEEINQINLNPNGMATSTSDEFELVKRLPVEGNLNHIYTQAKYTKQEMENSFLQTQRSAVECRDLLLFYSHVMRFYPRTKLQQNHLIRYKKAYANLTGTEKSGVDIADAAMDVDSHSTDICYRYFESLITIYKDMQRNVLFGKHILEERKNEQVMVESVESSMEHLNRLIASSTQRSRHLLLVSILRRVNMAYESFSAGDCKLFEGEMYFLLDQEFYFSQLLIKFIGQFNSTLHNLQCPEILQLAADCLSALCDLKISFEYSCDKIVSIFMKGDVVHPDQKFNDAEDLAKYPEFAQVFENSDVSFTQTVLSFQKLQERLSYLQEAHANSSIDKIVDRLNINIFEYLSSCRNEFMVQFISGLQVAVHTLKTNDFDNCYDLRSIKHIINGLVTNIKAKLVDGLLPYAINILNTRMYDLLTSLEINENELLESDGLCEYLYLNLRKELQIQSDELLINHYSRILEHHRIVTTAYCWLHEQHWGELNRDEAERITQKHEFLSNLHNSNQVLAVWKSTISKIQLDLESHRSSIREFLALSVPSSTEIYEEIFNFNEVVAAANQRYTLFVNLAKRLTEYSAVLLQFEIFGGDEPFEALVKRFKEDHQKLEWSQASITVVERNVVQLLDPEGKIDQYWIENISDLLDEMIFTAQKNLGDLEKEVISAESVLRGDGHKLQLIMDSSIRLELRQLLKLITKSGKQILKADNGELFEHIRDIQHVVKILQVKLNEIQIQVFSREYEISTLNEMLSNVDEVFALCQQCNGHFNNLMQRFLKFDLDNTQNEKYESPAKNHGINNKDASICDGQAVEQKRNAYAVSVWKRIRMKLEGRDPDPNRRSSVAEQVDHIISEATNEDNLASLYEGWTPWV